MGPRRDSARHPESSGQEVAMFPPAVPSLTVPDVEPDAMFLDVREPREWEAGHIEGALHIPLADVPARYGEIPPDTEVVVVCRSGGRSARVVSWPMRNGYDVVNLAGGMGAWSDAGREMVSENGEAPTVR
jgi:rhodanese-related sulfurtransferase